MTERKNVTQINGALGIILAGGAGTRMAPMTNACSKQLLPLYDKPMVYYPMTTLIEGGIRKVIIISQSVNLGLYKRLFGDGKQLGMEIHYTPQEEPKGLAESFIIADEYLRSMHRLVGLDLPDEGHMPSASRVCLILGDNIFHGNAIGQHLQARAKASDDGAYVFVTQVRDPERYGVAEIGENGITKIVEKPAEPQSNWAVTGLYVYPPDVVSVAKGLEPSARGELEITDVNNTYLDRGQLHAVLMGHGDAWLDSGTPGALLDASQYVHTIQERQGRMVGCPEEAAFRNGWINDDDLERIGRSLPNAYGEYLRTLWKTK